MITAEQRAACARKAAYPSKAAARDKASVRRRDAGRLYPYECPVCRRWHLTKMPPEVYRARARNDSEMPKGSTDPPR